ncbi:MAG: hypothetical protein ABSF23_04855 [Terracidiphilus sp.]|jgi:hypothetical protein
MPHIPVRGLRFELAPYEAASHPASGHFFETIAPGVTTTSGAIGIGFAAIYCTVSVNVVECCRVPLVALAVMV